MSEKDLIKRIEKLEKEFKEEKDTFIQEQEELKDRVITLENVLRSLVAMALERPEAIDWIDLSNFFIETDKG